MRYVTLFFAASLLCGQILSPIIGGGGSQISFYVSQSTGSDTNNGKTPATAFANAPGMTNCASNCAAVTLVHGQTVGFKAGDTWRETLTPGQSGTAGSPITYTSYGSGAQPVIDAADLKTWTQGTGNPAQDCANGTTPTFCSGMETGGSTFTDWGSRTQTSANITQSTAQVAHGSFSAALTGTGGNNQAYLQTTAFTAWANNSTHYARLYMYLPSGTFNAGGTQLKFLSPSTGGFITLDWNGTAVASVSLVGGAGGVFVGTLNTSAFTLNTWHYVDVMWVVSATVGGMQVWIDGTSIGSVLNKDTHLDTGATFWRVGMTGTAPTLFNSGQSVYFDDARFSDTGPIGAFNSGGAYPATVWRASQSTNPEILNFSANAPCTSTPSSCLGVPVASLSLVTAANDWFWDGSTFLYVYGPGDPTATVEVPTRNNAVVQTGKSFLTFKGLTFRGGLSNNVSLTGQTSGSVFDSDIFELSFYDGWFQIENSATLTGERLTNSIFRYNGASGMQVNAAIWTSFVISGNQAYRNAQIPSSETNHNFAAGLHAFCNGGTGGSGSIWSNNTVYQNGIGAVPAPTLAGEGNGIHIDTCTGAIVSNNVLFDNFQSDILLEKDINSSAYFNTITSSITHFNFTGGIQIEADSANHATGNLVAQNTLYGTFWWGLAQNSEDSSTGSVLNNTWRDNLSVTNSTGALYVDSFSWNSGANGNIYGYSGFGPQYTCFAVFAGSCVATYSALDTAYGSTMHNITTDPLFVSPPSNLALQSGSPAIGAGIFIPGVSTANPPNIGAK